MRVAILLAALAFGGMAGADSVNICPDVYEVTVETPDGTVAIQPRPVNPEGACDVCLPD